MASHIVTSFADSMKELAESIGEMGEAVVEQLDLAIDAIENRDEAAARLARAKDAEIDYLHAEIEKRAVKILALRNPVAVDLRATIAALQIARELERAGDLAKNIAKRCAVIFEDSAGPDDAAIVYMGRLSAQLVRDAVKAYEANDAAACLSVWRADSAIDDRCNEVFEQVLGRLASTHASVGPNVQRLFVAKNVERIGDHATNVAEAVYFVLTGDRIEEARPKHDETSSQSAPKKSG